MLGVLRVLVKVVSSSAKRRVPLFSGLVLWVSLSVNGDIHEPTFTQVLVAHGSERPWGGKVSWNRFLEGQPITAVKCHSIVEAYGGTAFPKPGLKVVDVVVVSDNSRANVIRGGAAVGPAICIFEMENSSGIVIETGSARRILVSIAIQEGCMLGIISGDRGEGRGDGFVRRRGIELELLELV